MRKVFRNQLFLFFSFCLCCFSFLSFSKQVFFLPKTMAAVHADTRVSWPETSACQLSVNIVCIRNFKSEKKRKKEKKKERRRILTARNGSNGWTVKERRRSKEKFWIAGGKNATPSLSKWSGCNDDERKHFHVFFGLFAVLTFWKASWNILNSDKSQPK